MNAIAPYFKLVQFTLLAVGGSLAVMLRDGVITGQEWGTLGVLSAGAAAVYFKRNTPLQPHAKMAVAVFTAGVAAVAAAWTDFAVNADEIVFIGLALIGAVQVGTVANNPPGPQPEAPGGVLEDNANTAGHGDGTDLAGETSFYRPVDRTP